MKFVILPRPNRPNTCRVIGNGKNTSLTRHPSDASKDTTNLKRNHMEKYISSADEIVNAPSQEEQVINPDEEATAPPKRRIFKHTSKKHAKKAAHRRLRHNASRCGIVCRHFHNYGEVYFHKTIQRDEPGIYIRGKWDNLPASSQLTDFLTEDQLLAWQVWRKRPRKMDRRRMRVNPRVTSRLKASSRPQEPVVQQPANSSKKMSTGQKIAIGVGAALGIGLGWLVWKKTR